MNRLVPLQSALSPHLENWCKDANGHILVLQEFISNLFPFSPLSVRFCLVHG
jgi:hypothetical protein